MAKFKGLVGVLSCALMLFAATVQAGVMGTATLVANPPGTLFTTDTTLNNAPLSDIWVSYVLGLTTDDGSAISAVDVTISGPLHQRWTFSEDTETFVPTPSSTNISNGDSHLTPLATSTIATAPNENNNIFGAPQSAADTASRDYGVGSIMNGAWGYVASDQSSSINFAYIVVPKGMLPEVRIDVKTATNPDQLIPLVILDESDFFGGDPNLAPIVTDGGLIPVVLDMINSPPSPTTAMHQFLATDDQPLSELSWGIDSFIYTGTGTNTGAQPTIDADGKLSWPADGWAGGLYTATVTATDAGGLFGSGEVSFQLTVPEPASLALLGLALVGFAGFRRK